MTHSLLLIGVPVDICLLQYQLNLFLDPSFKINCIHEIIAVFPGVYVVVFHTTTPLLMSLYYNLVIDDARILLPFSYYTVCFANKAKRMYKEPWLWKTNGPYAISNIILYKRTAKLNYTCEFYESFIK